MQLFETPYKGWALFVAALGFVVITLGAVAWLALSEPLLPDAAALLPPAATSAAPTQN